MRDDRGRFVAGPDKDRHQLTRRERKRGYKTALFKAMNVDWNRYAWFYRHVRGWYAAKRRKAE